MPCLPPETEKYAHVTFFFNGGVEKQFEGEERVMIPSPKVATYDQQPEMNAQGVADSVAETVKSQKYEFVMCNFAPPDMVGHTGDFDAAVKAITATDKAVQTIYDACMEAGYEIAITADHGNAEQASRRVFLSAARLADWKRGLATLDARPGHWEPAHRAHHQPGPLYHLVPPQARRWMSRRRRPDRLGRHGERP